MNRHHILHCTATLLATLLTCAWGASEATAEPANPFLGCFAAKADGDAADPEVAYHCFTETEVELWSATFELVDRAPTIWTSVTESEVVGIMARDGFAVTFSIGTSPLGLWDRGVDRVAEVAELSPVADPEITQLATAQATRPIPQEICARAAVCQAAGASDLGMTIEPVGDAEACEHRIGEILYLYMHFGVPAPRECDLSWTGR